MNQSDLDKAEKVLQDWIKTQINPTPEEIKAVRENILYEITNIDND